MQLLLTPLPIEPGLHLQGEPNHVTITAQFIPPTLTPPPPAGVPLYPTGFLLRHPVHSASRLSLITDLTNGWKIQHQNFANLSVVIGMSEHNEDFEAPALLKRLQSQLWVLSGTSP